MNNFGFWPDANNPVLGIFKWFFTKSYGVDVFLFLSGLSLYYSFEKRPSCGTFMLKRLKRVVPALLFTYGIKWIVQVVIGDHGVPWLLWRFSLMPFYIEGNKDGAWFFSCIILLYFAYPYIHSWIYGASDEERLGSECVIAIRAVSVCLATCLVYWLIHKYALDWFWKVEVAFARVPIFVIGCYVGHLAKKKVVYQNTQILVLLGLSLVWLYLLIGPVRDAGVWWYRLFGSLSGVFFAFLFSMFAAVIKGRVAGAGVLFRMLRSVGSYSLELYAAHLVMYYGVSFIQPVSGDLVRLLAYSVFALLWSWTAVRYLEPRFTKALSWAWNSWFLRGSLNTRSSMIV